MATQTGGGGLFKKYGSRLDAAAKQASGKEVSYGFQQIPGGIKNGVARLVTMAFETYKEGSNMKKVDGSSAVGEYYFRAVGVVVEPDHIVDKDGRKITVKGLQTSIMIPVIDTKNAKGEITSMEANIERIENEMKRFGVPNSEFEQGAAALEGIAAMLQEAAPHFKFETSQSEPTPQYPNPRVWENWYGTRGMEGYEPPPEGPTPGTTDDTGKAPPTKPAPPPAAKSPAKPPASKPAPAPAPEPEAAELPDDVRELATMAENGDDGAVQKLQDIALALGISEEEWGATPNFGAAADLIEARQSGEGGGEAAEEAPPVPAKGDVYEWFPVDPKTKKPLKKAVEVEITGVDAKTETVTAKRSDTKAVVKGIKFSELSVPA